MMKKNCIPGYLCVSAIICSPLAFAHHGQDFLVTLGAGLPEPESYNLASGFQFVDQKGGDEVAFNQSIIYAFNHEVAATLTGRYGDEGSGSWDSLSLAPMLQWNFTHFDWSSSDDFRTSLGVVAGWDFSVSGGDHAHGHSHGQLPAEDCSRLSAIPSLFQACQLANQNRLSHRHDAAGHRHGGIHRHGESHGFARLVADTQLGREHRIAVNLIYVHTADGDSNWGYAAAWRYQVTPRIAAGIELIGDFDSAGEQTAFATGTFNLNEQFTLSVGLGSGLNNQSSGTALQALVLFRF